MDIYNTFDLHQKINLKGVLFSQSFRKLNGISDFRHYEALMIFDNDFRRSVDIFIEKLY